jgi:purine-binding chemotaxis protein CheW
MKNLSPSRLAAATSAPPAAATEPTQYLTFMLAGETFAIGILGIKEIIEYRGLTEVPMMPACVRGVINLRGSVVPVLDPLARFGKASSPVGKRTCIVIVETGDAQERQVVGIVVDAVNEVLDIADGDIEPTPSFGTRIHAEFIDGIGKVNGRFVILLNVPRMLAIEQLAAAAAPETAH